MTNAFPSPEVDTLRRVYIGVLGVGGVGAAFLAQLELLIKSAKQWPNPTILTLIYLARSRTCLISRDYSALPQDVLPPLSRSKTKPLLGTDLTDYLSSAPGPVILVDNTSDQGVADNYPLFLRQGISVVTPNKKAFSGSLDLWADVEAAAREGAVGIGSEKRRSYVFFEAAAAAGFPLLSSLREIMLTGDCILKIEGVFSGSMSFMLNMFSPGGSAQYQGQRWSEIVKMARDHGHTEPDARDDLGGLDVARKLTMLARTLGLPVEGTASFPVQSLVPAELKKCSVDEFFERLSEFDDDMDRLRVEAENEDKALRFLGTLDLRTKALRVGIEKLSKTDPVGGLQDTQKIVRISTSRFKGNALTFQTATTLDVTAMNVTGDVIKVLDRIPQTENRGR